MTQPQKTSSKSLASEKTAKPEPHIEMQQRELARLIMTQREKANSSAATSLLSEQIKISSQKHPETKSLQVARKPGAARSEVQRSHIKTSEKPKTTKESVIASVASSPAKSASPEKHQARPPATEQKPAPPVVAKKLGIRPPTQPDKPRLPAAVAVKRAVANIAPPRTEQPKTKDVANSEPSTQAETAQKPTLAEQLLAAPLALVKNLTERKQVEAFEDPDFDTVDEPAYGITLPEELEDLGRLHEAPAPAISLSLLLEVAQIRSGRENLTETAEVSETAETPPSPVQVLAVLAEQIMVMDPEVADKATEKLTEVTEFVATLAEVRAEKGEEYVVQRLTELCTELLQTLQVEYSEEELIRLVELLNVALPKAQPLQVDAEEETMWHKYMREISGGNPFGIVQSLGQALRAKVASKLRLGRLALLFAVTEP